MDQLTATSTHEALAFVRKHRAETFFLYLAYHMPHVPLGVSPAFRGSSGRGLYGDAVKELAATPSVSCSMSSALSGSVSERLFFLTSDNGPWIDEQIVDHGGSAGTLRGGKMMTWEGGWRVPVYVSWPGQCRKGVNLPRLFRRLISCRRFCCVHPCDDDRSGLRRIRSCRLLQRSVAPSPRKEFAYHNGALLAALRSAISTGPSTPGRRRHSLGPAVL